MKLAWALINNAINDKSSETVNHSQVFPVTMGGIPSVVKKDNKVDPAIEFFAEQESLVKEGSPTLVSATRKNGQLVWTSFNHKSKPTEWDVFDVGSFKAKTGAKQNQPRRLPKNYQKNTKASLELNKQKILEKQKQAEKNRIKYLEAKKKAATSFVKAHRIREDDNLENSKTGQANRIARKHAKAAENRRKQLENIKAIAKKGGSSVGRRRAESQIHARAQHFHLQLETKMNSTQENRKMFVDNVIRKQQLREEHARRVRDKAQQISVDQVKELLSGLESDCNFCAPESDQYSSALWNDCSVIDLDK